MSAKNRYSTELKLKALGMLATGRDLKELVIELEVPYPKLLAWRKELREGMDNGDISKVLDCDELVIHKIAKEVTEEVAELVPEQESVIQKEVANHVSSVAGYKCLSTALQDVALELANKISILSKEEIGSAQIESLVMSLAKLQEAFFNKNVTNINILNQQNNNQTQNKFNEFKRG